MNHCGGGALLLGVAAAGARAMRPSDAALCWAQCEETRLLPGPLAVLHGMHNSRSKRRGLGGLAGNTPQAVCYRLKAPGSSLLPQHEGNLMGM
jgi:hypothetical protein